MPITPPRALLVPAALALSAVTAMSGLVVDRSPARAAVPTDAAVTSVTGPLQNSAKSTYLAGGVSGWWDTQQSPGVAVYPAIRETGVLSLDGWCIDPTQDPASGTLKTVSVGNGSNCLRFTSAITAEGFFTFVVNQPGNRNNGRYLGDGNRGGALDLIQTTPEILFAIPEAPGVDLGVEAVVADTNGNGLTDPGDEVSYTAHIENTGNVRLRDLKLTDELDTGLVCAPTSVDEGSSIDCTSTAAHVLTQADLDAGSVRNAVSLSSRTPKGTSVTAGPESVSTTLAAAPAATTALASDAGAKPVAGQAVTYTATVKNTGNVTLSALQLATSRGSGPVCDVTSLAAGSTASCTFSSVVSQADVDAGSFEAVVTSTATLPGGGAFTPPAASLRVQVAPAPAATLSSLADVTSGASVGQTVTYTSTVRNTGNVTLSALALTESIGGNGSCDTTSIAPGSTATCTSSYEVTQADVDRGSIVNSVTGALSVPGGGTPVTLSQENVTTSTESTPDAQFTTTSNAAATPKVGDTITYTSTIANTGTVTLREVGATTAGATVSCDADSLAPGATATCLSTHLVTQADVDLGSVARTVKASVTPVGGSRIDLPDTTVTDPIAASPAAVLAASSDAGATPVVGQKVTYTSTVRNTGNVTLSDVALRAADAGTVTCDTRTLAPGASATCTTERLITQADVDAGAVTTTLDGTAEAPSTAPVVFTAVTVTDAIPQTATTSHLLTSDAQERLALGDIVTATSVVTNTGNVTLDALALSAANGATVSCDVTSLAPGDEATCTSTHLVTQADVDAGKVEQSVRGSALSPTGATVEVAPKTVSDLIAAEPSSSTTTVSDAGLAPALGQEVTFTTTVTNTGNVTLASAVLTQSRGTAVTCDSTTIVPGRSITCTSTTIITQADVDEGMVVNTITGTANEPSGAGVALDSATSTDTIAATPSASIALSSDATADLAVGEEITYTARVTNTGNVTLSAVALTGALADSATCDVSRVAPGASAICTSVQTVTQHDVDAGSIAGSAGAVAKTPKGADVSVPEATISDLISGTADASSTVTSDADSSTTVGDTITFTGTITNVGTLTLSDLVVEADLRNADDSAERAKRASVATTGTGIAADCSTASLAPGASTDCTVTTQVTQDDIDSGSLTAAFSGDTARPDGSRLWLPESSVTTTFFSLPSARADLAADSKGPLKLGQKVTYTTTITNTGPVRLHDVAANGATCVASNLDPHRSTTCTSTRVVTGDDLRAGSIRTTVKPTAKGPHGTAMTIEAVSVTLATEKPAVIPVLAFTGSTGLAALIAAGASALVGGGLLFAVTRRRRRDDDTAPVSARHR